MARSWEIGQKVSEIRFDPAQSEFLEENKRVLTKNAEETSQGGQSCMGLVQVTMAALGS